MLQSFCFGVVCIFCNPDLQLRFCTPVCHPAWCQIKRNRFSQQKYKTTAEKDWPGKLSIEQFQHCNQKQRESGYPSSASHAFRELAKFLQQAYWLQNQSLKLAETQLFKTSTSCEERQQHLDVATPCKVSQVKFLNVCVCVGAQRCIKVFLVPYYRASAPTPIPLHISFPCAPSHLTSTIYAICYHWRHFW